MTRGSVFPKDDPSNNLTIVVGQNAQGEQTNPRLSLILRQTNPCAGNFSAQAKSNQRENWVPNESSQAGRKTLSKMICDAWWKFYLFFIVMGAFTKMVTLLWFLRILTSLNSRVRGVLSAAFCLPKSPCGQSVASAEGGNGLMKLLGMRGHSLSGGPSPRPALSLQAAAAGGQWSRRRCTGPAASSLAARMTVCCLKRREGSWWSVYTEKASATPAPAGRGTHQKAMEEAAPANCLCAHYFPQGHRWETGSGVWRGCEQCLLGLDSFCLHFTSC